MNANEKSLRVVVRPISITRAMEWVEQDDTSETHKSVLKVILEKYHKTYAIGNAVQIFELMYATKRSDNVLGYLPFLCVLDYKRSDEHSDESERWYVSTLAYHAKTGNWIEGRDTLVDMKSDIRMDYVVQAVLTILDVARQTAMSLAETSSEYGVAYEGAVTKDVVYDGENSDRWLADATELLPFVYAASGRVQSWLNGRKRPESEKALLAAFSDMLAKEAPHE